MRIIVGIDPSLSSTGIALINQDTENLIFADKITTSPKDTLDDRIQYIVNRVLQICSEHDRVVKIYIENSYMGVNVKTTMLLCQLRGALSYVLHDKSYKYKGLTPKEVRLLAGANGKLSKEEVALFIQDKFIDCEIVKSLGQFWDKAGKKKNSDIYDAIFIALAGVNDDRQ